MSGDRMSPFAVVLLVLIGGGLVLRAWTDRTPPVPRKIPPAQAPAVVEEGAWVIPPGREGAVSAWLAPALERGVGGRSIASIELRGSQVRASLEGGGAIVVRAEGDATPRADVSLEDAVDPDLVATLEARPVDAIFVRREPPSAPPSRAAAPAFRDRLGILGPAVARTGLSPAWLVLLALALGGVASLGVHTRAGAPPSPRATWDLVAAIVVASGLRVAMAAWLPLETDEVRPLTSGMALFSEGHDAWLHPPLFRALGTAWVELVGWRPGGSALLLRAPTVVVSALAAAFALAAGHRLARGAATYRIAHVALLVAPPFVGATVLARPYSLVALLTAVSLWSIASRRGALAVAAAGLALWADPIGGALLALFVIAHLLTDGPRHRVAVALLALSLFAAPLIEGVAEAAAHPVLDAHYDAAVAAGQRASSGMGDAGPFSLFGRVLAFAGTGLDLAWLGLPAAVGLAAILARRRRPELGVALAIALGIACAIGLARSVRPRNLVVLPIGFAVVASAAAAKREDHPERHPERQEQR